jgi:MoaA/NifB/PqqE/SkfB family radical SAM enzyme
MFKFSELRSIHLEITNNCQASCPMCSRNIHGGLDNPLIALHSWSLDMFKTIMTKEVLDQLDSFYFCGNFGDPILNNDLLEMCEYASALAPTKQIRIHTNGGARGKDWWVKLATVLPINHTVTFAIDGLSGTHELYRIGTTYNKVIENARAFIQAGGNAEWAFIRFKHNEDQVETAKLEAKRLGFKNFVMKDSSRFLLEKTFDVVDKEGRKTHKLEPSGYSEIKFIDRNVINRYKEIVNASEIDCQAIKFKEIYIDAFGRVFPCCFIAMIPYIPTYVDPAIIHIREDILKEYNALITSLGGIDKLDAYQHTIETIINNNEYQTVWAEYWKEKKLITCARSCGVMPNNNFSKPIDQFILKEVLE